MNSNEIETGPSDEAIESSLRQGHQAIRLDETIKGGLHAQMRSIEPQSRVLSFHRIGLLAVAATVLIAMGVVLSTRRGEVEPGHARQAAATPVVATLQEPRSVTDVRNHIAVALPSRHEHIEIVQVFPVFDP